MGLMARLRPTEREVYELALRETEPRSYARFTPITRGFGFAVLALLLLGLLLVVSTPFWAIRVRR